MTRAALFLCTLALPASAETARHSWYVAGMEAWVEMHAPTAPGAVASVTFHNRNLHQGDEPFALTFDGMTVDVHLEWNVNGGTDERITVTPPEGFVAHPTHITVPEDATMTLHIYTNAPGA